jgi:hypothetical protein
MRTKLGIEPCEKSEHLRAAQRLTDNGPAGAVDACT